jgi:tetratricopeptide (TPR) repeat protein
MLIPLFSQYEGKARLKGTVTDPEGNPVAEVKVKLFSIRANSGFETKTDQNGLWKAMWIRGGHWNIDFEKKGYSPKKISTNLKEDSKIVTIDISLQPIQGPTLKKDLMKDFEKGNRLFDQGEYDQAVEIYKKIIEEFPDAYQINLNIGNCYFEKQEYETAVQAYLKVVEKEPANIDVILSIGNSYSNLKQFEKALEWYNKIEVAKINDHVVLYNIGIFYFNRGNIKEAIPFFKHSVEVKEDFLEGWYQLGMAYMGTENNEAAVTAFKTYLKHDSVSEQAKQVQEILSTIEQ